MKIAIFSDIHSNYLTFKKGYDDSLTRNIDMYLFLGDYVTDGFDGNKVLDIVRSSRGYAINGNREVAIVDYVNHGNEKWDRCYQYRNMKYGHDILTKDNLDYIKSLPIYRALEISGKKILMAHALPSDVKKMVYDTDLDVFDRLIEDYDADIYLLGHMHLYFYKEYKGKHFLNAGSIGSPVYVRPFSYSILDIDDGNVSFERVKFDISYDEIEKYYKNSDYYKKVPIWSEVVLRMIKTARPIPDEFIALLLKTAKTEKVDITNGFPNDFFEDCFKKYEEEHKDDYTN